MIPLTVFFFITFCGVLGIFFRRNLLNQSLSLLQIIIGTNGILSFILPNHEHDFSFYLIVFLIFTAFVFLSAISILLIKRRSTLNIDELTELRG